MSAASKKIITSEMKLRVLGAVTFCQMTFGPIEFSQIINNYVPTRRTQILKGVL